MNNLKEKTFHSLAWAATGSWATQFSSLVIIVILARLLAPQDFGLVALASSFSALFDRFKDQGFTEAIIQRKDITEQHLNTAFWANLFNGFVLMGLFNLAAPFIADFYKEPVLTKIIFWISLNFPIFALSAVQQALMYKKMQFKSLSIRMFISRIAAGLVGIIAAFWGYGVWSLVAQNIVFALACLITMWTMSDWRPKIQFSFSHFKSLFSFGMYITGTRILNYLQNQLDKILIGFFLGTVALGFYEIGVSLCRKFSALVFGITSRVSYSLFSQLQLQKEQLTNVLFKATEYTNIILFPIFFGLFVLAHPLIMTLYGEKWLPSVGVVKIFLFGEMFFTAVIYHNTVLLALGKSRQSFFINLIPAIIFGAGFLFFVDYGIYGICVLYTISRFFASMSLERYVHSLLNYKFNKMVHAIFIPMLCGLLMAGLVLTFKYLCESFLITGPLIVLIICFIIGVFVYVILMYLVNPVIVKTILSDVKQFMAQVLRKQKAMVR